MKKVVAVEWRSAEDTVGIVLCQLDENVYRAYMGTVRFADAQDADVDAERIANHGCKMSYEEAVAFFPYMNLKREEYKGVSM